MPSDEPHLPARPFWVTLESIGANSATLIPHHILMAGETFFVDCVEYDVAAIMIGDTDPTAGIEPEIKYIMLRTPLPDKSAQFSANWCVCGVSKAILILFCVFCRGFSENYAEAPKRKLIPMEMSPAITVLKP